MQAGDSGTVPFVSDIVIHTTVASGVGVAGIVFSDTFVATLVTQLVKRNVSTFLVMGNDDAGSPVDHTGEWTSDAVTAADWEVAMTNLISGTFSASSAAVGVYQTFATADMIWTRQRPGGKGYTPGTTTVVADFTIREVADTGNATTFQVTLICTQT